MNTTVITNNGALIGIWTEGGLWGIDCRNTARDCNCGSCVYGREMNARFEAENPHWRALMALEDGIYQGILAALVPDVGAKLCEGCDAFVMPGYQCCPDCYADWRDANAW